MKRTLTAGLIVLLGLGICPSTPLFVAAHGSVEDPVKLQGTWVIDKAVMKDNIDVKLDSDKPPTITFKMAKDGNSGSSTLAGVANTPGGKAYLSFIALPRSSRVTLDPKSEPATIDFTLEKGKKLHGICKAEGEDTLLLCLSTVARPAEFDVSKEPKDGYRVLITLKRKK